MEKYEVKNDNRKKEDEEFQKISCGSTNCSSILNNKTKETPFKASYVDANREKVRKN